MAGERGTLATLLEAAEAADERSWLVTPSDGGGVGLLSDDGSELLLAAVSGARAESDSDDKAEECKRGKQVAKGVEIVAFKRLLVFC